MRKESNLKIGKWIQTAGHKNNPWICLFFNFSNAPWMVTNICPCAGLSYKTREILVKFLHFSPIFTLSDKCVNFLHYCGSPLWETENNSVLSTLNYRYKILYGDYNLINRNILGPILSPDGNTIFNTCIPLALAHLRITVSFSFQFNDGWGPDIIQDVPQHVKLLVSKWADNKLSFTQYPSYSQHNCSRKIWTSGWLTYHFIYSLTQINK